MFTGIVESVGEVKSLRTRGATARLQIALPSLSDCLTRGESVAVNGVCLTAEELPAGGFAASVSAETLERSTLGRLGPGARVNIERALAFGGRLGGHLVTGHVDAVGRVRALENRGGWWNLAVEAPEAVLSFCVEKGSVAVDGISLTIASLATWGFSCAVVPHTFAETNLKSRRAGDEVNLEADLIGKYVARLLSPSGAEPKGVTWETLRKAGYL